jgi:hypothetical protein
MKTRLVAALAAVLILGVATGCKSTRTVTKKRSADPILSKFASNFNVGEEGYMVSNERSEYENRDITKASELGAKQFNAPAAKKKAFEGSDEYKGRLFSGSKRKAREGSTASYETATSDLGNKRSRMMDADPVTGGTYDTRKDAVTGGTFKTGENRMVRDREGKMPDPYIIKSGADSVSVDGVRKLLGKD